MNMGGTLEAQGQPKAFCAHRCYASHVLLPPAAAGVFVSTGVAAKEQAG
jgi:hypothetical protein